MVESTVYIDESGDLGCGTGTKWFVITAVIVDKTEERQIRQTMNTIRHRLNVQEIHLRRISDYYKRAYVVRELNNENFTYLCRMLLERVSWFLRDTERKADIVLSARGTSRDRELIEYIKGKLIPYKDNQIEQRVFGKITAKSANSWDMLQLADVCATTTFLANEVNGWGFRTPCFFRVLRKHLYKYGNRIMSYGMKYFTEDMKPENAEINADYPCKEKERTSGATSTD